MHLVCDMRPTLILQPVHNSSADILRCFAQGKPLSGNQLNFLDWHEKQLSSHTFDPVLKYYLQSNRKKFRYHSSFLLPHEILNKAAIEAFKKRLALFLRGKYHRVILGMSQKQFFQFQQINAQELIFWHGNQYLTGAPFIPGGIPPVIYFQWGNYFGVAKYVILAGEKALRGNLLVYFEDLEERTLEQCVKTYEDNVQHAIDQQHNILYDHGIEPTVLQHFVIKTPTLKPLPP